MTHGILTGPAPRCATCGITFGPARGGVCEQCGKRLCARHLHGVLRRWLPRFLRGRACPGCRRGLRRLRQAR